ncbi:MAG: dipeptide epimerase [Chloroflexi bacterium]|nr:dipeptide epimerase [Chloroflexota bacterium]
MSRLTWESITLDLRSPFHLSYGVSEIRQSFWLRLADDEGWGEAAIPPYYKISESDMTDIWESASHCIEPFPDDKDGVAEWVGSKGPAPARCALDLALHDRIARDRGLPLFKLLGLPAPTSTPTAFTISIESPEKMAERAKSIPKYSIIKLKLGSNDDLARVAAVRAARPDVKLYVDANAGWTVDEAIERIKELEPYNLELIEQPLPKEDIAEMGYIQKHTAIPIVADESVQVMDDIEALGAAGVKGVNLKLMKIGGLAPALKMLQRARELGMKIMLGCMVETSLGVTAMAHISALADWVDLDAPLLIKNDPFDGVSYENGEINISTDKVGIGVVRK